MSDWLLKGPSFVDRTHSTDLLHHPRGPSAPCLRCSVALDFHSYLYGRLTFHDEWMCWRPTVWDESVAHSRMFLESVPLSTHQSGNVCWDTLCVYLYASMSVMGWVVWCFISSNGLNVSTHQSVLLFMRQFIQRCGFKIQHQIISCFTVTLNVLYFQFCSLLFLIVEHDETWCGTAFALVPNLSFIFCLWSLLKKRKEFNSFSIKFQFIACILMVYWLQY